MLHNLNLFLSGIFILGVSQTVHGREIQDTQKNKKKNILFIAVDDLKPLLGCYGDPIARTPNIDFLASQGTLFEKAYCQQAVSGPTRASLLTGMCPDRTCVWDLKTLIRNENPDVVTLPQYFKANGYWVAGIGKIFDQRSVDKEKDGLSWTVPFTDGWEYLNKEFKEPVMGRYQSEDLRKKYELIEKEGKKKGLSKKMLQKQIMEANLKPVVEAVDVPDDAYQDGAIANGAIEFLNQYDGNQPFFLAVGIRKPHLPFCAPVKYWNMYNRDSMSLAEFRRKAANSPDFAYHDCGEFQGYSDIPPLMSFSDIANVVIPDEKAKELIHGYYACVSYADALVGNILSTLEEKGLKDNTIIVFWGDHGWHLGDHGLWNKHTNFEQATHVPMLIVDPSLKGQVGKVESPVEFLDIYPTLCDLAGIEKPAHLDGESLSDIMIGKPGVKNEEAYAVSQYPRGDKMGYSLRTSRYRYTVWVKWENKRTDVNTIYGEELYDYKLDVNETINVVDDNNYATALKQMKLCWDDFCRKRIR